MTADECVEWVRKRIKAFSPFPKMPKSDVTIRLTQVMHAAATAPRGTVFAFPIPSEIFKDVIPQIRPLLSEALAGWRAHLAEEMGEEGIELYRRMAIEHGVERPSAKPVAGDPAIREALTRLRLRMSDANAANAAWRAGGRLERGFEVGFAIAPPADRAGEVLSRIEMDREPLPKALEALYAETNGIFIGPVLAPGGERPFGEPAEPLVLVPLQQLFQKLNDRDDELIVFDRDPVGKRWTMIGTDGAIFRAEGNRDDIQPVAPTMLAYIGLVADSYGPYFEW